MKTMKDIIEESLAVLLRGQGRLGSEQFYPAAAHDHHALDGSSNQTHQLKQLKPESMDWTKR
jgi:hypothetical protein